MPVKDQSSNALLSASRRIPKDLAIAAALLVAAGLYYGQYYDHGFNVSDEGSAVLITQRLMEGERPFLDVEIGYGLLWFYPLILLFKWTGVSFIALRIYFFALATITSLLTFLIVRRHTGRRGIATAVALLVLALPGTPHKTYIPLIVAANMLCLPLLRPGCRELSRIQILVPGLVAAISFHIRPDLGLVAMLVLLTVLALQALTRPPTWRQRLAQLRRVMLPLTAAVLVPTLPLILIARHQGFLSPFLDLLRQPFVLLAEITGDLWSQLTNLLAMVAWTQVAWANPAQTPEAAAATEVGKTLARIPFAAIWQGPKHDLAILTYLPILTLGLIAGLIGAVALRRVTLSKASQDVLGFAAILGLTCSTYPQFFLFRPDLPHLSQFMPGYLVLVGIYLGRWLPPIHGLWRAEEGRSGHLRRLGLLARWATAGLLLAHVVFYVWYAIPRMGTGSIALARDRTERFQGASGVDIAVTPEEREYLDGVMRVVEDNTTDDDILLCVPYCPGFNVITGRRTILRRLYLDDGMLTMEPDWQQRITEQIDFERVPLIVVRDWAPNRTEISRFKNWATVVMEHLASCYELTEKLGHTRFYRRASGARAEIASDTARVAVCAEDKEHLTDIYLQTLEATAFERQGTDYASPLFDPQRVAEQVGRPVEELVGAVDYDFERLEEIDQRLVGVDRERALREIFEQVTDGADSNIEKHVAVADFLGKALRHGRLNPTYRKSYLRELAKHPSLLRVMDPLLLLELGEGGSGRVAAVAVDIWRSAGMEARHVRLGRGTVAEVFYDGGWHYLDADNFGGAQMVRNPDGTIPSLAELSRTPLAIDRPISQVEPSLGGRVVVASPRYPSHSYFGACSDCGQPRAYRYKIGTRRQQSWDRYFGWTAKLTRLEKADDLVISNIPERFQPGAPRLLNVDIGAVSHGIVAVDIRWRASFDRDDDLAGYRVFVSRQSRGWSYHPDGAAPGVLPYWSHPAGWKPEMYDLLFELPKSDVTLVETEGEQISLELEADDTYYVTVMPFDAHGEAIGRKLYRSSQELKIPL